MMGLATRIGAAVRLELADVGASARLFFSLLARSPKALARFVLVREQVFHLGNKSLSIIGVSGLFVGFVLALQGYYTLQRYGSAEAVGMTPGWASSWASCSACRATTRCSATARPRRSACSWRCRWCASWGR